MPWTSPIPPGKQPPGPSLAPAEMDLLVARAGLTLNPGQMADLVLTWRQLGAMIASLPRRAVLDEDRTGVFRLPPPQAAAAAKPKPASAKPAAKLVRGKPAIRKPASAKPASAKPPRRG